MQLIITWIFKKEELHNSRDLKMSVERANSIAVAFSLIFFQDTGDFNLASEESISFEHINTILLNQIMPVCFLVFFGTLVEVINWSV